MKTLILTPAVAEALPFDYDARILVECVSHHQLALKEKQVLDQSLVLHCSPKDLLHSQLCNSEEPFYVANLAVLEKQLKKWKKLLPRIEPFYAVKCNPDPLLIKKLISAGISGFDCASKGEIEQILSFGVEPDRIVYANPCKQASFLKYSSSVSVNLMTFDNKEELFKIKKNFAGSAKLVLRIITDDKDSICRLSSKFGAPIENCMDLLLCAKELDLEVVGVSFHVGSGCLNSTAFRDAVISARQVFDMGISVGFDMNLLDVGGGFPGTSISPVSFEEIASVLGSAVDELFPLSVRVISEPGRFFAASAFDLAVNITARRSVYNEGECSFMYYVNDGVYGSFNCILFDHADPKPIVLTRNEKLVYTDDESSLVHHYPKFKSSVWGPTCDSMDLINKEVLLPALEVGDWLLYKELGAYTSTASSTFNGFQKSKIFFTDYKE